MDERLPSESPGLYSMHPNAELEFMTATSDALFKTLLELQPRDSSTGEGASHCTEEKVKLCIIIIIVIINNVENGCAAFFSGETVTFLNSFE